MASRLRDAVVLPVPERTWSAAEWAALDRAARPADMDRRWSAEVDLAGLELALVRSGRFVIFEAVCAAVADGGRRLVDLRCEGDGAIFGRAGFADDAAVARLFLDACDGLIAG